MKTYIRKLTSANYKSLKDIYEREFAKEGFTFYELYIQWKFRDHNESLGIYNYTGDLLGFVISDGDFIPYIAIHPHFHGMNLGTKLMKELLRKYYLHKKYIYLYPMKQDIKLVKWYTKLGFQFTSNGFMVFHSYNTRSRNNINVHS